MTTNNLFAKLALAFQLAQNPDSAPVPTPAAQTAQSEEALRKKYQTELDSPKLGTLNDKIEELVKANGPFTDITFLMKHRKFSEFEPEATRVDYNLSSWLDNAASHKDPALFELLFAKASDKEKASALRLSAQKNNTLGVTRLLEKGIDVNNTADTQSPLFEALEAGHMQMAKLLIKYGADVRKIGANGESAAHRLFDRGFTDQKLEIMKLLVDANLDLNIRDNSGNNLIKKSLGPTSPKQLEFLLKDLKLGHQLHEFDSNGELPQHHLLLASGENNKTMALLEVLQQYGANVNTQTRDGDTLLSIAIKNNRTDIVEWLLLHGADPAMKVNPPKNETGKKSQDMNALHIFTYDGTGDDLWIGKLIINADRNLVNSKDANGCTPLMLAVKLGRLKTVEFLLANGADLDVKDNEGKTVFDYAETENKIMKEHTTDEKNNSLRYTQKQLAIHQNRAANVENILTQEILNKSITPSEKDIRRAEILQEVQMAIHSDNRTHKQITGLADETFKKSQDMMNLLVRTKNHEYTPKENLPARTSIMQRAPATQTTAQNAPTADSPAEFITPSRANSQKDELYKAVQENNLDAVKKILTTDKDKLKNVYSVNGVANFGLLHVAAQNNATQVAKFLLDSGIEINQVNGMNRTALSIAAENGSAATARLLIESTKAKNPSLFKEAEMGTNWGPIQYALRNGDDETIKAVLEISPFITGQKIETQQQACEQFPVPTACPTPPSRPR